MSGRKKYSNELKLQIAHDYENGNGGYDVLSRKYDINRTIIQRWVRRYNENGVDGLCKVRRTYDGDFKISVVEYMHKHSMSIKQAVIHFNIQSMATVSNWERIYYEKGEEALYEEKRGRSKMKTKKLTKPKKDIEQNEDLLAEVQRLRMENEYLKKLNALVQEREKSASKTK